MDLNTKFVFTFACVTFLSISIYAQDVCVKKSSCTCEFSNGTGIDLTPIDKSTFFTAQTFAYKMNGTQIELSTYYFHPCFDVTLLVNTTTTTNSCDKPLAMCRYIDNVLLNSTTKKFTRESSYELLGETVTSSFSANGDSLIYAHGPSTNIVLLTCAETDGQLQIYSLEEPNKIVLQFYSKDACLKQIETGRSLGSTLLIILFSFIIFYLVLGICTKKFLMGATGIEVVPNLAFWSDLPNLVKDGWAFMINGFKLPARGAGPMTSPDPNSYDSI